MKVSEGHKPIIPGGKFKFLLGGSCISGSIFFLLAPAETLWDNKKPYPMGKGLNISNTAITVQKLSWFPTRSSFGAAYRKRLYASATLGKPLFRECLVYRHKQFLWKLSGSGLCVSRWPLLPRTVDLTILYRMTTELSTPKMKYYFILSIVISWM